MGVRALGGEHGCQGTGGSRAEELRASAKKRSRDGRIVGLREF